MKIIHQTKYDSETEIRLDRYLRELYSITQGLIEKYLRKGDIRVNGEKVKSSRRLGTNDIISYSFDPTKHNLQNSSKNFDSAASLANKITGEYQIFENENFLVINKPSKLSAQGGDSVSISVDDALNYINKEFTNEEKIEKGYRLVHRLDKDTSGLMFLAKNRNSASILTKAFKDKLVEKTYLAILCGIPDNNEGVIKSKIKKDLIQKKQITSPDGDYAETIYKVVAKSENYSLVEFKPLTGRMHQIRVHSLELGFPILGDKKYGNNNSNASNLFLHSYEAILSKDIFGTRFKFKASLPKYFEEFITRELKINIS